jgi:hypothetical protein
MLNLLAALWRFGCVILFMICSVATSWGQYTIQGSVRDSSGQALVFVSVVVKGVENTGVFSDIDGRFRLELKSPVEALEFRYVGYNTRLLDADAIKYNRDMEVVLETAEYALPEARVVAGENPADILMRKVVARRHDNNPEKKGSYRCHTYNKLVFDLQPNVAVFEQTMGGRDTSKRVVRDGIKNFGEVQRSMEEHHGFIMESVTERSFRRPDLLKENVLLNRVSGTEYAGLVTLASAVQPFSFYGDYLQLIDKDFVNPVSPQSERLYFFALEDTLYSGVDTVWLVSFHPKKGKVFTGLEGVLYVHSDGYAVQHVRAWPAEPGKLDLMIEQSYQRNTDPSGERFWFPDQLNFEISFEKYPATYMGLKAVGHSYIQDAEINLDLRNADFDVDHPILLDEKAHTRSDSIWSPWRTVAPLTRKEVATYTWLDSVGEKKNLETMFRLMDYSTTGLLPVLGPINLDVSKVLRFNQYERTRLGLGLSTAQALPFGLPKRAELAGYAAYGFGDQAWKYGASGTWRIHRGRGLYLSAGWNRDLTEPGVSYELSNAALIGRAVYARRMDMSEALWAEGGSRLWKGAQMRIGFRHQKVEPLYAYGFRSDTTQKELFQFAEATLFFRYAANEQRKRFLGGDLGSVQKWPVLEFAYTKGFPEIGGSTFAYQRFLVSLYQSVFIRRLGRCSWRVDMGYTPDDLPLNKLFTLNQPPGNTAWGIFTLDNTFQSLPDTLFAFNQFVNLYFTQELGPVFYKTKYSSPFLSLHQNATWGSLLFPESHLGIGIQSAPKPILESGVQLDDLLRVNYVNVANMGLGVAVYYRWGGLSDPDWKKNVVPRLSLRFTL